MKLSFLAAALLLAAPVCASRELMAAPALPAVPPAQLLAAISAFLTTLNAKSPPPPMTAPPSPSPGTLRASSPPVVLMPLNLTAINEVVSGAVTRALFANLTLLTATPAVLMSALGPVALRAAFGAVQGTVVAPLANDLARVVNAVPAGSVASLLNTLTQSAGAFLNAVQAARAGRVG